MDEVVNAQNQGQFMFADLSTRLRDLDERNRLIRERTLLLGKNLIQTKDEMRQEVRELKRMSTKNSEDLEVIKNLLQRITLEMDRYVKRDEMVLLERMLKDFQPLEFMRKKDVEDLILQKLKERR